MRKVNYIYLVLLATLLFVACSSDDVLEKGSNNRVELSYSISNFNIEGVISRATDVGSPAEQQIDNLYLFLFDAGGANPIKYYVDNSFSNGQWNTTEGKITLELTQAEAGTRQVYLVANVSPVIKTTLDGVSTLAALKAVKSTVNTPWSSTLTTPILMSGNATHNFVTNRILSSVPLTRALAKIELNVTLPAKHQDADASHYRYNFIDFDKNTYVLKPTAKTDELVTSGWQAWQAASTVSSYTLTGGKVANLKVITYINERDNPGSYIDIQLPYNPGGPLPPPEFGGDTFKLPLPSKIERNYWYKFDVTL
jgi:hypothetical protein